LTLDRWCELHHLVMLARIVAERVRDSNKPPTEEQRRRTCSSQRSRTCQ
jgi:hypothetical protein